MSKLEVNVFATTEEEMYGQAKAAPVAANRSLDQMLIDIYNNHLGVPEAGVLFGQAETLRQSLSSFLASARVNKTEALHQQHEAAIEVQREAHRKMKAAEADTFTALQKTTALDGAAKSAASRAAALKEEFAGANHALLTRAEKNAAQQRIADADRKAQEAQSAESKAFADYRNKVDEQERLTIIYNASVNAVMELARQIDRLK